MISFYTGIIIAEIFVKLISSMLMLALLVCPAQDKNLARAGVLKIENGNAEVQTIDVEYDVDSVIHLIDEIKYPDSDNIKKIFLWNLVKVNGNRNYYMWFERSRKEYIWKRLLLKN